jgi:hypothetical protein
MTKKFANRINTIFIADRIRVLEKWRMSDSLVSFLYCFNRYSFKIHKSLPYTIGKHFATVHYKIISETLSNWQRARYTYNYFVGNIHLSIGARITLIKHFKTAKRLGARVLSFFYFLFFRLDARVCIINVL